MTTPVDVEHCYDELLSSYPFLFMADGELRCRCGKIFNPARVSDAAQIDRHLERDRHVIWASEQEPEELWESFDEQTSDHDSMNDDQPVDNCPDTAATPPPPVVAVPFEVEVDKGKEDKQERGSRLMEYITWKLDMLHADCGRCRLHHFCTYPNTLRGCVLCTSMVVCVVLIIVGSLAAETYADDHHATREINDAVAAYDANKSVLNHVAAGSYVKIITTGYSVIGEQALRSRVVTRELTGWTTGLTTKWIGGVTVKTDGLVNFTEPVGVGHSLDISLLRVGEARDLNMTVPFPNPWILITKVARIRTDLCHPWCRKYGAHEEGGSISGDCLTIDAPCKCTCKYRRYITTACYVVEDDGWGRSTTLKLRKEKPTCGPPYTLEAGHSYHSRYPVSIEVELRASNDPLLVALFVTDGTMRLSGRGEWLNWMVACLLLGVPLFCLSVYLMIGCLDLFPRSCHDSNWKRSHCLTC